MNNIYFFLGLILIWAIFSILMGLAVLARIITRTSYLFFGVILYFFIYFYYTIWENFNEKYEEILDLVLKKCNSNNLNLININNFKKILIKFINYLANDPAFIVLTLLLTFLYTDGYYYAENKLALILLNQIKGRDYSWWDPNHQWEP